MTVEDEIPELEPLELLLAEVCEGGAVGVGVLVMTTMLVMTWPP